MQITLIWRNIAAVSWET